MELKNIVKTLREVLNSPEIQKQYGALFAAMPEDVKINFQICLLYKLAENDPEIMNAIGQDVYEALRA